MLKQVVLGDAFSGMFTHWYRLATMVLIAFLDPVTPGL